MASSYPALLVCRSLHHALIVGDGAQVSKRKKFLVVTTVHAVQAHARRDHDHHMLILHRAVPRLLSMVST